MNDYPHTNGRFSMEQQERVKELEELIALAESSTFSLDKLSSELQNNDTKILAAALFASAVLSIVAGIFVFFAGNSVVLSEENFYMFGSVLVGSFLLFLGAAWFLVSLRKRGVKLKYDRLIELDIQRRLISMIDQQVSRVMSFGGFSPVNRVIIDIKVKRMARE
ncbi:MULTISPECIES: hypothetical protein [unclassified Pseudomonas]|uniref:hypothetical protein n=1 Tax=unclassified Pseudomonas TaxID=196821 RepID=UPI001463A73B|nr:MULTISPECIES: hypothetical protein [unclassified Pseudomonas]QJI19944.1 hypothetical protein HKK57_17180 [Pseudomonas sp. ADAK21]QJI24901.1 hypothetical protein HKK56_15910 [Pseudomonas sp. ADAK20]